MKLVLNSLFVSLLFICTAVYGDNTFKKYIVKVGGIKIGTLNWEVVINNKVYTNEIHLKSHGFLSALYKFEGNYYSKGFVENSNLKPEKYTHVWKTNKVKKNMNLIFEDQKLKSLDQSPFEKEYLRQDVFYIKRTKDPLSSFLQIIMGSKKSLVIDGRRLYTMSAFFDKKTKLTTVKLLDYSNLWADHKRSQFEKIVYKKKDDAFLPSKILIYFDGRVFNLEQI